MNVSAATMAADCNRRRLSDRPAPLRRFCLRPKAAPGNRKLSVRRLFAETDGRRMISRSLDTAHRGAIIDGLDDNTPAKAGELPFAALTIQ
jgi:hypothetical protein